MVEDDFKKGALCVGPFSWERNVSLLKRGSDLIFNAYSDSHDRFYSYQLYSI
jgi:hypothetical protein